MNFNLRTATQSWKLIRLRQAAQVAAVGTVLTVAGLVSAGTLETTIPIDRGGSDGPDSAAHSGPASSLEAGTQFGDTSSAAVDSSLPAPAHEPKHVVYLTDSPEMAAAIHGEYAAIWLMLMESGSAPAYTFTVLDTSTPEGVAAAEHINSLLLSNDPMLSSTEVVDARYR